MVTFKFSDVEREMDVVDKKIKVMHLCSYIGYDGPSRGIMAQAKYMDSEKFHTTICEIKSSRNEQLIKEVLNMGCGHIALGINKAYDISSIFRIARELRRNRIDILNTHNTLPCWYGNIAAKIARIPAVFTLRNVQSENYKFLFKKKIYYKVINFIDCVLMKSSDCIVANSERLRKYYVEKMKVPERKIIAIQNAIDLSLIEFKIDKEEVKRNIGVNSTEIVIGVVGDLVERKNHICLIEAANIIVKKYSQVRFLIVGDGPLRKYLLSKIEKYGLSANFIFTGHTKDVNPLFSTMDIFVLPSFAEGISRALMESMAMGIVSVGSDIDGNLEAIINGETGLIFPVNDYKALANQLLFLINDENARLSMGRKAAERARMLFDMRNYASKYSKLYLKLINKNSISKIA